MHREVNKQQGREFLLEEMLKLKAFVGTFIKTLIVSVILLFLFGGLIFENLWGFIIFFALFVSILITAFMEQDSRIGKLENQLEQMLNDKKDSDN